MEFGKARQEDLPEVLEEVVGAFADRIDLGASQAEDRAVLMLESESAGGRSPHDRYPAFRPRAPPFQVAAGAPASSVEGVIGLQRQPAAGLGRDFDLDPEM